jgi:copper oxidase (laccase) domain-containing protein
MIKKGCKLENITAVIGPSISQKTMKLKKILRKSLLKKIKKIYIF